MEPLPFLLSLPLPHMLWPCLCVPIREFWIILPWAFRIPRLLLTKTNSNYWFLTFNRNKKRIKHCKVPNPGSSPRSQIGGLHQYQNWSGSAHPDPLLAPQGFLQEKRVASWNMLSPPFLGVLISGPQWVPRKARKKRGFVGKFLNLLFVEPEIPKNFMFSEKSNIWTALQEDPGVSQKRWVVPSS